MVFYCVFVFLIFNSFRLFPIFNPIRLCFSHSTPFVETAMLKSLHSAAALCTFSGWKRPAEAVIKQQIGSLIRTD